MADMTRLAFVMALETRLVSSGSQPDSLAQRLVDPRLPAPTGRAEIGEHSRSSRIFTPILGASFFSRPTAVGRPDQRRLDHHDKTIPQPKAHLAAVSPLVGQGGDRVGASRTELPQGPAAFPARCRAVRVTGMDCCVLIGTY